MYTLEQGGDQGEEYAFQIGLQQETTQRVDDFMKKIHGNNSEKPKWKLPNFVKRGLGLVYRVMPKSYIKPDGEEDPTTPRIESLFRKWWMFSGSSFKKAVAFAVAVCLVIYVIQLATRSEPTGPIYKNRHGVLMTNVKLSFSMYENPREWILTRTVKELFNADLSQEEIESGFFKASVRDVGDKNVSISLLEESLKENCKTNSCRCISTVHLGVAKNVVFLRSEGDADDLFMINPVIAEKSEKTIRVAYQGKKSTHQDLHNMENWVKRPAYITVEYNKRDGKIARKQLDQKGSACVYECISFIKQD